MSDTPSIHERARFDAALQAFKRAADDLAHRWECMPGDAVDGYPAFMPSFDEAANAIQSMTLRATEYRVHLRVTVRAQRISDVNDDVLADALLDIPEVVAVTNEVIA
jgi:hypothetical protein